MSDALTEILKPGLKLQSDILTMLISRGQHVTAASDLACDIIDMVFTSEVATPELREAYKSLEPSI